jgi:hypothetical protein
VAVDAYMKYCLTFWHRHHEYRSFLIDHLINITLRHWDPVMRRFAAQSLGIICSVDLSNLVQDAVSKIVCLLIFGVFKQITCH